MERTAFVGFVNFLPDAAAAAAVSSSSSLPRGVGGDRMLVMRCTSCVCPALGRKIDPGGKK